LVNSEADYGEDRVAGLRLFDSGETNESAKVGHETRAIIRILCAVGEGNLARFFDSFALCAEFFPAVPWKVIALTRSTRARSSVVGCVLWESSASDGQPLQLERFNPDSRRSALAVRPFRDW
jgi:hypothetical protein